MGAIIPFNATDGQWKDIRFDWVDYSQDLNQGRVLGDSTVGSGVVIRTAFTPGMLHTRFPGYAGITGGRLYLHTTELTVAGSNPNLQLSVCVSTLEPDLASIAIGDLFDMVPGGTVGLGVEIDDAPTTFTIPLTAGQITALKTEAAAGRMPVFGLMLVPDGEESDHNIQWDWMELEFDGVSNGGTGVPMWMAGVTIPRKQRRA